MFMPVGQLTFDEAVPLFTVIMLRKFEKIGRVTRSSRAYTELNAEWVLGGYLAAGMIKTYGIITKNCCSADPALVEGVQIELPPSVWTAPKALDRIRLQMERGERVGEQPYLGGKVLPTMFRFDFYRCLRDCSWPLEESDLKQLNMWATSHADRVASLIYIGGQPQVRTAINVEEGQMLSGAEQRRGPGGAPPKYDWDAFWIEIAIWIEGNGFTHGTRSDLQQHMQDWTAERWKEPPHAATIRDKLKALFETAVAKGVSPVAS